jgi:hypothetical protein
MPLHPTSCQLGRAIVLAALLHAPARAQEPAAPLPSFAELEAAGARIGEIRIAARDIFDTTDPNEDKLLFRWANALHIQTRAGVIERALLFKTGDVLSVPLIEETERLLRSNRYLYDVQFRPLAVHDGVVDMEVATRDTWTLDLGASAGRSGGANTGGVHLKEYNLFGTGMAIGYARSSNVDRSGNEFQFANERLFGSRASLGYSHATTSDGRRDTASLLRPFYALDARWAAGLSAARDDRIDAIYGTGKVVGQYRHRVRQAEVFGGWSAGLEDGWVQRWALGLGLQDDQYAVAPGLAAPTPLPQDQKLVSPFLRHEWIEDRFEREQNRNLIGRPEFFALGFASTAQVGWAAPGLGSSRQAWLYNATLSRGFEPAPEHRLIASGRIAGEISDGQARRQRLGAQAQYYLPQGPRWLFYAAASGDLLTRPATGDTLLLGGDNGLRGYPLRYQSGTRRALFTLEERFYTDLYVWRLFRVGGAGFIDVGRAWGGGDGISSNSVKPGWLSNFGAGLRIVSARAAFSNVLHIDIAFPLDADADIKRLQFLVKSRTSF